MRQITSEPHVSTQSNPGILLIAIKDKTTLHHVYMPFLSQCGLFIPTNKSYQIGDEVFMLLNLLNEPERMPLSGRVVWITPVNPQADQIAGIGVSISSRNSHILQQKINTYLADYPYSDKPSYTM